MIWFAWRQFRVPAWITLGGLSVLAVVLAITGHSLAEQWASSGAANCHADCSTAIANFIQQAGSSVSHTVDSVTQLLVYAVPPIIGLFWGAPLVARELEAGTHRLAWTQSVTRGRWTAAKLALVGTATAATAGLLSWAVTAWATRIDVGDHNRINPMMFGARGVVPIGYALFAFTLGVALGMLMRHTVRAMAATFAIYVVAVGSMPLWVRAHLMTPVQATIPLDFSQIRGFRVSGGGQMMTVIPGGGGPSDAWLLTNITVTSTGHPFTGPVNSQACIQGFRQCVDWLRTLGLRQQLTYQPASHFWALQGIETGIFVALAAVLAGFCLWWTRRLT
jgi:ABC-type transport system involved in multi-copper enzyme maturation permease subunit